MKLADLLDLHLLERMLGEGYVKATEHPEQPLLVIYNYTPKAQYDQAWNDVTRQCRGLIVHNDEVVARPFPKFHNYGEHEGGTLDLDATCEVTDKLDGSLGILYPRLVHDVVIRDMGLYPDRIGGFAIATRGSFTSDQALHATTLLHERYGDWAPDVYATYLYEIVYPSNRIVVDYGELDDLILLAVLDTRDGTPVEEIGRRRWPGPRAETHPYETLAEALAAEPRPNAEGYVVYFPDTDVRVKLKQDDYVALHRILTGTNARNVWEVAAVRTCAGLIREPKHWGSFLGIDPARAEEILALGGDWLNDVPDEFYTWVADVYREAEMQADESFDTAWSLAWDARAVEDRRERYEMVATHPFVKEIMRLASAKTGEENDAAKVQLLLRCWREACPAPTAPFARTEDVA